MKEVHKLITMKQSIKPQFSSTVAVALLLLLFAIVILYLLVIDASYTTDWKETRKFPLTVRSCTEAEQKAVADFDKGVIRMFFSSGVVGEHHTGFPYNFYKRLEEDFGIDIIYTGDVCCSFSKCYNLKMDELLEDRLGKHTIEGLFNELHDKEYPR